MEYSINENRLRKLFINFMDSQYDLTYDSKPREFLGKDGEVFGFVAFNSMKHTSKHTSKHFYYGDYKTEYFLNEMFGELTNELLLHYFRERFPDLKIDGIE
jgi:hypothetical protein